MFVDASALCAILLTEADAETYAAKLKAAHAPLTSGMAIFETVLAIARVTGADLPAVRLRVAEFVRRARIQVVEIGEAEQELALDAFDRFGKGRHRARLNMGDCFAYACARTHGVSMLYKGDDFSRTDIAGA